MSAKRYATQELARIEVYGHNSFMTARMKNLSSTGAFFEISQASFLPKAGDLINVTVRLNTLAKERHVSAEVVWTKGLGLGVCFVSKEEALEKMFLRPTRPQL